jgi:hypothetical protein
MDNRSIVMINRENLQPHPDNPRKDLGDLTELRESIRENGIMQNLTVVPVGERIAFAEHYGVEYCDTLEEKAFDCPMPEDGQQILISKSWGVIEDVAYIDIDGEGFICYGLEGNGDWDGVDAWMPKPERYKKEGESDADS